MNKQRKYLVMYIFVTLCIVLLLMPLHGFLTTWIGSNTGGLLIWRAWKEIVLVPAVLAGLYLFVTDSKLRSYILRDRLSQAMAVFTAWLLVVATFSSRDLDALTLGATIYLRLFLVYILARIALFYRPVSTALILKVLLIPLGIVVSFGLLQMFVLPRDFLSWFGYEKGVTIPPYFMIDQQLDVLRIASTSRGPNSLGVYLILPILILITLIYQQVLGWAHAGRTKVNTNKLLVSCVLLLGSCVVLYGSHSRSAWVGLLAGLVIYAVTQVPRQFRKFLYLGGVVLVLTGGSFLYLSRDTTFVQNTIVHDNPETGGAVSSNEERFAAWQAAVEDIRREPLAGCGPGCAGPASFHHNKGARIAENQYLQAGQELGIIGAVLLLVIFALVVQRLWQRRDPVSLVLLSSFIGISVAGLLMHAWADDIVAYVWWIPFGLLASDTVQ